MAREKKTYRANLEELMAAFPNRKLIQIKEAADWLGVDQRTAKKMCPVVSGTRFINIINLASWLSM